MIEDEKPRKRKTNHLWLALAAVVALLAILIVPPLVSVSRYKARITQLISTSLGRPVRLSSVEVRLLPRPGFVLTDLTVQEDPAYGAEPTLHAETVTASIRLLSLWRGHLELDTISVDNASVNLLRTSSGHWNLDSLLRTATAQAGSAASGKPDQSVKLPYLEATNSRINIKNGVEKLPFSLTDAKFSFWQENPGDWRVRLRGQPVRTDLSLEQADTGVVRLEASLRQASELRLMPVHVDLEWREAQLGQLTRLVLGTDPGWRGDLTGELHIDGTAEAAQIKSRLRAIGVHRAEFTPAAPMDFDANCALVAHFSTRAIDNLVCDSQLGTGHVRLTGTVPGNQTAGHPALSVAFDRVPVAFGLAALRTVRSGLAPGLEADGAASGQINYAPVAAEEIPAVPVKKHAAKSIVPAPLTGSLTVDGLVLHGNGLSEPLRIPKLVLEPAPVASSDAPPTLAATFAIPAGGTTPLTVAARFALTGYQIGAHGLVSIVRGRELAHLAGYAQASVLDALAGEAASLDLTAVGPWLQPQQPNPPLSPAETLTGTVTLHNANWKADYLVNRLLISQATLHLESGVTGAPQLRWDPVAFSYGPVKGTASLILPSFCETCTPSFQIQFGALDAGVLQAAFLGAQVKTTLLSTLIERLRPTAAPPWPLLEGTVKADSLVLGPVTLHQPAVTLRTHADGAEITAFNAALLGGSVHGTGTYHAAQTAKDKPAYAFEGQLEKLSPPIVGQMLGLRSKGGVFNGNGKIALSGFTGDDLAASAKGSLHFDWEKGKIAAASGSLQLPQALARFDHWTADAEIANGALTLKNSEAKSGNALQPVEATIPLIIPPKIVFAAPKLAEAKH